MFSEEMHFASQLLQANKLGTYVNQSVIQPTKSKVNEGTLWTDISSSAGQLATKVRALTFSLIPTFYLVYGSRLHFMYTYPFLLSCFFQVKTGSEKGWGSLVNWVQSTNSEDGQDDTEGDDDQSNTRTRYYQEEEEDEEEETRNNSEPQELLIDIMDDPVPPPTGSSSGYGSLSGNGKKQDLQETKKNDDWNSWGGEAGWGDDWGKSN